MFHVRNLEPTPFHIWLVYQLALVVGWIARTSSFWCGYLIRIVYPGERAYSLKWNFWKAAYLDPEDT